MFPLGDLCRFGFLEILIYRLIKIQGLSLKVHSFIGSLFHHVLGHAQSSRRIRRLVEDERLLLG